MPDRYEPNPIVIETELPGELILLDPETQAMFSLNQSGCAIWRALPGRSVEEAAQLLVAEYEVETAAAERDVRLLADHLMEAGLLRVVGGKDDG